MAKRSKSYRKIWIQANGPIPKDGNGRSLEIHHIDGNHTNNDLSNLTLVTIDEHYEIHKSQEDWGACYAMAQRLKKSADEISFMARQNAVARAKAGTLPMQISPILGSDHHWSIAAKNGKHPSTLAVQNGTFRSNFTGRQGNKGIIGHTNNQKMLALGTHPSQIKVSCLCCKQTTSINSFARNHIKTPCK